MKIIDFNFKLFIKSHYLFLSLLFVLLACNAYMIWAWINMKEVMLYLNISQQLGIICFIVFSFISYEFLKKTDHISLYETLSVIHNGRYKLYLSQLIVLLFFATIFFLNILVYNLAWYFMKDIAYTPYLIHIIVNNVLNILLPVVVAILLGSIFALKFKRISAYAIMIFIIFCISPIFENVSFPLYQLWQINIYPYWDVFRILAPNLNWIIDKIYGIAIESSRWDLIIFWIVSLFGILFWMIQQKKNRIVKIVSCTLALIAIFAFYRYLQPGSIVRMDYNPNAVGLFDYYYETKNSKAMDDDILIPANFDVSTYDLKLEIGRQLQADVTMTLNTNENLKNYTFTLYRGYNITEITDADGNALDYKRYSNYFTVNHKFNNSVTQIHIKYNGSGNKYYSNSQGIALPGYFPYYPMAGHLQMWDSETKNTYVNTDFTKKQFNVTIDSNLNIISNLEKKDFNYFEGTATSMTLIGGFINEEKTEDISIANYIVEPIKIDEISLLSSKWEKLKQTIGETRDISFEGKKIMILPLSITARMGSKNEGVVILSDHILLSSYNVQSICWNLVDSMIPYFTNKNNLKSKFLFYLFDIENFNSTYINKIPSWDLLTAYQDEDLQNSTTEESRIQFMQSQEALGNLLRVKIETLGEEHVLKAVYHYLIDENNTTDEITFLYYLQ